MEIKELAEHLDFGLKVLPIHLSNKMDKDGYLYLNVKDIQNNEIYPNESSVFVAEKTLKKLYANYKDNILTHNDILVHKESYTICIYNKQLNDTYKGVIVTQDFLLLRPTTGYLNTFFYDVSGKVHFTDKLKKILEYETTDIIEQIEQIDIPLEISRIEEVKNEGIRNDKRPVDITKIDIEQGVITIDRVLKKIDRGEMNINTSTYFQRKGGLWSDDVKMRLIEAMIVRQPIPAFYFDTTNNLEWLIIDGLQRITTINDFVNNRLKLNIDSLYYLDSKEDFDNKTFDELPRWAQVNIEDYEITAYRMGKETPKEVKYKIFRSINTSALKLEPQEIRHALNYGKATNWLEKLANRPIFKTVMPLTKKMTDRMEDEEYALRYLAFRIIGYNQYTPSITEFLDEAMTKLNTEEVTEKILETYEADFGEALFTINHVFGGVAFKRIAFGDTKDTFTNPLYEIMVYAFSVITQQQREHLMKNVNKSKVLRETRKLIENKEFAESIENDKAYTKHSVKTRFEIFENHIKKLLQ